jgi:hypothetical protein
MNPNLMNSPVQEWIEKNISKRFRVRALQIFDAHNMIKPEQLVELYHMGVNSRDQEVLVLTTKLSAYETLFHKIQLGPRWWTFALTIIAVVAIVSLVVYFR